MVTCNVCFLTSVGFFSCLFQRKRPGASFYAHKTIEPQGAFTRITTVVRGRVGAYCTQNRHSCYKQRRKTPRHAKNEAKAVLASNSRSLVQGIQQKNKIKQTKFGIFRSGGADFLLRPARTDQIHHDLDHLVPRTDHIYHALVHPTDNDPDHLVKRTDHIDHALVPRTVR